jgi:cell division topological specificity factor
MKGIFDFFRPTPKRSAAVAKERLQILLAHERTDRDQPDFLPLLQQDILAAISKYLPIDRDKVVVKLDRGSDVSTLEVNVEMPGATTLPAKNLVTAQRMA